MPSSNVFFHFISWMWCWCTVRILHSVPFYREWWLNLYIFQTGMPFLCLCPIEFAQRSSACTPSATGWIPGVSPFWLWPDQQTWLSGALPSEFVSYAPLPAWSWHEEQTRGSTRGRRRTPISSRITTLLCRSSGTAGKLTSWVEAVGQTLCVFLPAMFASFSPEPYRAKGCLLCLLSSPRCCADAALTLQERFDDLEGLRCLVLPPSFSTIWKDEILK